MSVSHETVYHSLFIQAPGVLKKELMDHLESFKYPGPFQFLTSSAWRNNG